MSSKLLVNLALLNTKFLVNAYTWTTLPFYAIVQRPWRRLKLSKSFNVKSSIDKNGRTVYSRPSPVASPHPYYQCLTFPEILPKLDLDRKVLGVRDVLSEQAALDSDGKPIRINGVSVKIQKLASEFKWKTVGQVMKRVDSIARGLRQLGVGPGDKVLVYAENGVEWQYICLALLRLNAVTVTLYSTLADSGVVHGINESDSKFVITSQNLLGKLSSLRDQLEHLYTIIYIPSDPTRSTDDLEQNVPKLENKSLRVHSLAQIESNGTSLPECNFPLPKPDDLAVIMYTSGTTGAPKGVVITHGQMYKNFLNLWRFDHENGYIWMNSDAFAVYLPMAHIFGYMINLTMFVSNSKLAFCSPMTLMDSSPALAGTGQMGDIKLIKPEFLIAVPLMLERIMKEIRRKLNERSQLAEPLFNYLMDYKIRWTSRGYGTPIINRLFCKNIGEQLGGKLKYIIVSGAPLHERTQALVSATLNVNIVQGYGSTEMVGGSHMQSIHDLSYGSSGIPSASLKYYLEDWAEGGYSTKDKPNPRGEIVVGGENIAQGYYKLPDETEQSFHVNENGLRWFKSGDIGEVLPNGTLKIVDRKKDLIKLPNGEFVSLGKIEAGLRNSQYVDNICVCTDSRSNHVTALISPNQAALSQLFTRFSSKSMDLTFEQMCSNEKVNKLILDSLRSLGKDLGLAEKELPVAIQLVSEQWSPDNELLTAALKVKRKQVHKFYSVLIERMFN